MELEFNNTIDKVENITEQACATSIQFFNKNEVNPDYFKEFINYICNCLYKKAVLLNSKNKDLFLCYTDEDTYDFLLYNIYDSLVNKNKSSPIMLYGMSFDFPFYRSLYEFIAVFINFINFNFNKAIGYTEKITNNKKMINFVLNKNCKFITIDQHNYPCFVNKNLGFYDENKKNFHKNSNDNYFFNENNLLFYLFISLCLIYFIFFMGRLCYINLKKKILKTHQNKVNYDNRKLNFNNSTRENGMVKIKIYKNIMEIDEFSDNIDNDKIKNSLKNVIN